MNDSKLCNFAIAFGFNSFCFFSFLCCNLNTPWKWVSLYIFRRRRSRVIWCVSVSHVSAHTYTSLLFGSSSLFICNFYQLFVAHMCHNSQSSQLTQETRQRMRCNCLTGFPLALLLPLRLSVFQRSLGSKFHENSTVFIRNCILNASQLPQVATGNCCGFCCLCCCTFVYVEKHKLNKRRCWWQKKIVNPKRKRKQ